MHKKRNRPGKKKETHPSLTSESWIENINIFLAASGGPLVHLYSMLVYLSVVAAVSVNTE